MRVKLTKEQKAELKVCVNDLTAAESGYELACQYYTNKRDALWKSVLVMSPNAKTLERPVKGDWHFILKEEGEK